MGMRGGRIEMVVKFVDRFQGRGRCCGCRAKFLSGWKYAGKQVGYTHYVDDDSLCSMRM